MCPCVRCVWHLEHVSYTWTACRTFENCISISSPPFENKALPKLCFSPKTRETEFNFGDHRVDPPRTRTYEARMTWMAMVGSATGGSNGGGGGGGGVVVVVGE